LPSIRPVRSEIRPWTPSCVPGIRDVKIEPLVVTVIVYKILFSQPMTVEMIEPQSLVPKSVSVQPTTVWMIWPRLERSRA
jgi:hypothetical protein